MERLRHQSKYEHQTQNFGIFMRARQKDITESHHLSMKLLNFPLFILQQ